MKHVPEWFPGAYFLKEDRLAPEKIEQTVDEVAEMFGMLVDAIWMMI